MNLRAGPLAQLVIGPRNNSEVTISYRAKALYAGLIIGPQSYTPNLYKNTPIYSHPRNFYYYYSHPKHKKISTNTGTTISTAQGLHLAFLAPLHLLFHASLSDLKEKHTVGRMLLCRIFPPVFFWKEFIPSSSALLWHDFVLSRSNTLSSNTLSRGFSIPCQKALSRAGLELVPLRWMVKLFLMLFESRMVQVQAHACRCADQRA